MLSACLILSYISTAQVGIGTETPQAQLEVSGGNVRFSNYGSGNATGDETYLLGVDAEGDIVELPKSKLSDNGLQCYTWDIGNETQPNINNKRNLGVSTSQGIWNSDLNNDARAVIAPDNDGYIINYVGTIKVENSGDFTFSATSDDGTRVYVDDVLVVENWFNQVATTRTGTVNLAKGEHRIEFWYYERAGAEVMEFNWGANPDGYIEGSVINSDQFYVK